MEFKKGVLNSQIGAFLGGIFVTVIFFIGASAPDEIQENVFDTTERSDSLEVQTSSVIYADVSSNSNHLLMRGFREAIEESTSTLFLVASEASSSATTSTDSAEDEEDIVLENVEIIIAEEISEPIHNSPQITYDASEIEKALRDAKKQLDELQGVRASTTESSEERALPEGVYVLANGDYVDINGDKISGDPFAYNYKAPKGEDNFTTPGGVVMDRFGNIIFTPEVVDESKVLIPPTVIDPDNPPSTVSPIYIPRYVMTAMNRNPFLTCAQMQLFGNDRALCELRKESESDYEWIRVDEIEE